MIARVIPRLDIKGPNLVKGVHLEGLRVLGKPEAAASFYYAHGADELFFMDIVASLYGRNSLLSLIERVADGVFVPLTVGGGIRTIDDIRSILRAGADKVAINTAAVRNPDFISEAAYQFGSSTIVISIEAIRRNDGEYEAYTDNGREKTGLNALEWAKRAAELGAGELLVTSIDREGTGRGYDLNLLQAITRDVSVPVIASGGAGSLQHILDVARLGVSGIAVASMLHYHWITQHSLNPEDVDAEINLAHLKRPGFGKIDATDLVSIKAALAGAGFASRDIELIAQ